MHKQILAGAEKLGFTVTHSQAVKMEQYGRELLLWNKKINLTAITEPAQVAEKHFIDSMAAADMVRTCGSLADMGSGGGFPGIVLKIMNPGLDIVLIDSVRKKVNFLKHVIRTLELKNIDAVHSRAEDLHAHPDFSGRFDCVISRAFADLDKFVRLAGPLIHADGRLLAMKGRQGRTEILPEIEAVWQTKTLPYTLPFEQSQRWLIELSPRP